MAPRRRFLAGLFVLLVTVALFSGPAAGQEGAAAGDQEAPEYQAPQACGYCHDVLYGQFEGTMHDLAAVDPLYLYEVKLADEQTEGAVGPFCLKCHSPIGDARGETTPPTGKTDGTALSEQGRLGVTCDFCHTVTGKDAEFPGNASFESSPGLTKLGPWKDSVSPGHDTAYSEFHKSADFCGMCHDVNHPVNGLALEATYTEWKNSEWAKQGIRCQDCHMTPGAGPGTPPSGTAAIFGPERPEIFEMNFTGANAVYGDRARAEERLKGAAAVELALEGVDEVRPGDPVKARVTVKNVAAGHSLPTGLTDLRRMWLEVSAVGGGGEPVRVGMVEYHTVFADEAGNHDHVPVWFAASVHSDYRIPANGQVVEEVAFVWPEGVEGDATVAAELKYMSFSQEIADKAKLGVQVPIIVMATAEEPVSVASRMGWVGWILVAAVVVAFGLAALLLSRRRPA